ncbi:MAG TPA: hypothetical protein VFF91_02625 [Pseudoxanthomonas sp.]|nr:hypothetical protein [Pseudoxanthomonas sp.]
MEAVLSMTNVYELARELKSVRQAARSSDTVFEVESALPRKLALKSDCCGSNNYEDDPIDNR